MFEHQNVIANEDQTERFPDLCKMAALPETVDRTTLPEPVDLEMPRWIWGAMCACYATFFAGLIAATGHNAEALFMLTISVSYVTMFFGTSAAMFGVSQPSTSSAFARGLAPLQTWTGPMSTTAVAAQILTVPACLAFFGLTAWVIRVAVLG